MPRYATKSMSNLMTCERDIQVVCLEVVKVIDNSVIFGNRSPQVQFDLFKKGRRFTGKSGEEENPALWVVDNIKEVVTYRDGYVKKSNHNYEPSRAVDLAPYPINWGNEVTQIGRFYHLAGFVLATSRRLYEEGKVERLLKWGGDWDSDGVFTDQRFHDLPHFELIM